MGVLASEEFAKLLVVSGFRMLAARGESALLWPKLYKELSKHDVKLAGMLEVLRVHDSEGRLGAILGSYEELFPMKAGKEIHQFNNCRLKPTD